MTKNLLAISTAFLHVIDHTPLLAMLPHAVKVTMTDELLAQVRTILTVEEVDQPNMYMAVYAALDYLPLFSVFNEKAKREYARNIIDQVFPKQ